MGWYGSGLQTPLVNAIGVTAGATSYVIVGPVTVVELDRLAAILAGSPDG